MRLLIISSLLAISIVAVSVFYTQFNRSEPEPKITYTMPESDNRVSLETLQPKVADYSIKDSENRHVLEVQPTSPSFELTADIAPEDIGFVREMLDYTVELLNDIEDANANIDRILANHEEWRKGFEATQREADTLEARLIAEGISLTPDKSSERYKHLDSLDDETLLSVLQSELDD